MIPASETGDRPRLLVVEDDPDLRDALSDALSASGYSVDCAVNGREALDYLEITPPPCLVLLDLMMPVMNGWEFRAEQVRNEKIASIPVVLLTAETRADLGVTLGADECLTKPIELGKLLAVIARYH
ncbi:MAG: response regulator [Acidobacteriota bacterium]|nr:response regulator [Acidobacteriota bacterium]